MGDENISKIPGKYATVLIIHNNIASIIYLYDIITSVVAGVLYIYIQLQKNRVTRHHIL